MHFALLFYFLDSNNRMTKNVFMMTELSSAIVQIGKVGPIKTKKSFKCQLIQYCRKYKSIYDESIIFLSQKGFRLQLEALSNCDNFTVITILYNNDVLT